MAFGILQRVDIFGATRHHDRWKPGAHSDAKAATRKSLALAFMPACRNSKGDLFPPFHVATNLTDTLKLPDGQMPAYARIFRISSLPCPKEGGDHEA